MSCRRGIAPAGRLWAAVLLCAIALCVGVASAPHQHVSGAGGDCAVCKATHTVATLDETAGVRSPVEGVAGYAPIVVATILPSLRPSAHGPRAPPAL